MSSNAHSTMDITEEKQSCLPLKRRWRPWSQKTEGDDTPIKMKKESADTDSR